MHTTTEVVFEPPLPQILSTPTAGGGDDEGGGGGGGQQVSTISTTDNTTSSTSEAAAGGGGRRASHSPSTGSSVVHTAVLTVSSLYSTAQCILSMIGSIGVILLFAGIPQLIYSPVVQLSNLLTFMLGAGLICAMVGGNAFVNYKYRQYLHGRNQAALQSRRLSRERREAADKPPSYDDLDKLDSLPPPDYHAILEQKPPRYEDIASLYRWGAGIDGNAVSGASAGCSDFHDGEIGTDICAQPSTVCGASTARSTKHDSSQTTKSMLYVAGHANMGFEMAISDPTVDDPIRKYSTASVFESRHPRIPPVHRMLSRFKRSKSYSAGPDEHKLPVTIKDDFRFVDLKKLGKAIFRSTSEDSCQSLPMEVSPKKESTGSKDSYNDTPNSLEGFSNSEILKDPNSDVTDGPSDSQVGGSPCSVASLNFSVASNSLRSEVKVDIEGSSSYDQYSNEGTSRQYSSSQSDYGLSHTETQSREIPYSSTSLGAIPKTPTIADTPALPVSVVSSFYGASNSDPVFPGNSSTHDSL